MLCRLEWINQNPIIEQIGADVKSMKKLAGRMFCCGSSGGGRKGSFSWRPGVEVVRKSDGGARRKTLLCVALSLQVHPFVDWPVVIMGGRFPIVFHQTPKAPQVNKIPPNRAWQARQLAGWAFPLAGSASGLRCCSGAGHLQTTAKMFWQADRQAPGLLGGLSILRWVLDQ